MLGRLPGADASFSAIDKLTHQDDAIEQARSPSIPGVLIVAMGAGFAPVVS